MRKVFTLLAILAIPTTVMAQKPTSSKITSGEAGYRAGCAAARSAGVKACEELYQKNQLQKIDEKRQKQQQQKQNNKTAIGASSKPSSGAIPAR
jgi:hypothetical protein